MKEIIKVQELLPELGVPGKLPLIGYVFSEQWGKQDLTRLTKFFKASKMARQIMLESDAEWERLRPLTKAKDDATLLALREGYRDGVPKEFGKKQEESIQAAFKIVANLGGRKLVGNSSELSAGTLWPGETY